MHVDGGHRVAIVAAAGAGTTVDHGVGEALAPLVYSEHQRTVHRRLNLLVIRRLIDVQRHRDVDSDGVPRLPRVVDFEIGRWGGGDRHWLAIDGDGSALG